MRGYIQVYTGNGKGKTTAALGLAMRAAGAGLRVYIAQFVKRRPYSETEFMRIHLQGPIRLEQFGRGCFIREKPEQEDFETAAEGIAEVRRITASKEYDLIILDEIHIALHFGLINTREVLEILKNKPPETEMVLTGRYAPREIIEAASLVTEMKEIKHYYTNGVEARKGIEF